MERMDAYRRIGGLLWVAVGLLLQVLGLAVGWTGPGLVTWVVISVISVLSVLALVRPDSRGARAVGRVTATLLALDLVGAVADRFGALGRPGSPGVSWGDWSRFEDYTAVLLHGPAPVAVTAAAVGATVVEVALGLAMASGWQRRWIGKAVAGLFVVYLLTMLSSAAREDVLRYAMPVLIGGALLVSATPGSAPDPSRSRRRETVDA